MKDGTRKGMEMNGTPSSAVHGNRSPAAGPDPEISAKATRQRFTPQYKLSPVERADACETPGEIGRLLRRGGLYSLHLSAWWKAVRMDLGIRRSTFCGWYRRHKDKGCGGTGRPAFQRRRALEPDSRHGSSARRRQGG